jgi:hypothetical protein
LRLQQVVGAPAEKREDLLKELEHFAFRGIPSLSSPRPLDVVTEATASNGATSDNNLEEAAAGEQDVVHAVRVLFTH